MATPKGTQLWLSGRKESQRAAGWKAVWVLTDAPRTPGNSGGRAHQLRGPPGLRAPAAVGQGRRAGRPETREGTRAAGTRAGPGAPAGCSSLCSLPSHRARCYVPHKTATTRSYFKPSPRDKRLGGSGVRGGASGTVLTAVGVVSDDVVPPAPVPQKQGGVPGPRHDVAVPAYVRL